MERSAHERDAASAAAAPRFGDSVRRREDVRLVTGAGRYADDVVYPDMLHATMIRAAYAHARIASVDVEAASQAPGIVAVLSAVEAAEDGLATISSPVELPRPDGSKGGETLRPLLCHDRVRHVGEPVVMIVAETARAAQDAADLVGIEYDPLPASGSVAASLAPGAPAVWNWAPDNVGVLWRKGDFAAAETAIGSAAHVTRAEISISRVTAAPLEPRSATGAFEDGRLVLRTSYQSPHLLRGRLAKDVFNVEPNAIRVIAEDVGGSFGMKSGLYREDVLVLWAAKRLGRPVHWTSGRAEAFLADEHARETKAVAELALDADGRFLAFRVRCDVNIGAYLNARSLPLLRNIGGIAGVYRTPNIVAEVRGIFSNTSQTSAYRGAGRPEATYLLERTVDIAARELGMDPFDLRIRNLIPPEAMPFDTRFVFTYDCGEFAGNMTAAADMIDLGGFRERREAALARGKLRGLGISNPIEVAAGPFGKPSKDMARISVEPDGTILLKAGIMSVGQGLETAMTQLAAAKLGVPAERIRYMQGDTDLLPMGRGNGGSSALAVGGSAISLSVDGLIDKARELAAQELEVSAGDLEFAEGAFRIVGTDRVVSLFDLGRQAHANADPQRPSDEPALGAEAQFQPPDVTYPNGCHICEVEIDPETGQVELVDYVAVEDAGRVLNPLLVEGQMHGGIAQGVGQALKELIVYDASGELLTGSFNDYGMPTADGLPMFRLAHREVPTAVNPLGVKGVGEAGTVGSLAATVNAVCDALSAVGISHFDMPATPNRVWAAIEAAKDKPR